MLNQSSFRFSSTACTAFLECKLNINCILLARQENQFRSICCNCLCAVSLVGNNCNFGRFVRCKRERRQNLIEFGLSSDRNGLSFTYIQRALVNLGHITVNLSLHHIITELSSYDS